MPSGTWNNADGLVVKFPQYYGNQANFKNNSYDLKIFGATKQIEMNVDLTVLVNGLPSFTTDINNDGTLDGFNTGNSRLPPGASVTGGELVMSEAAVGGTSIQVGTYGLTGVVVSPNSLITATNGTLANMNLVGKRIPLDGSLAASAAGTQGVGTYSQYIGITPSGTFTAGKGRLIIRYIDALPDTDPTR